MSQPSWADARDSTKHGVTAKGKEVEQRQISHARHPSASQGQRHSIGKSPLAIEVVNASSPDDSKRPDVEDGIQSEDRHFSQRDATSTLLGGLATDPAQIVNLALSLSETRRRQAHTPGLSSSLLAYPSVVYPTSQLASNSTQDPPPKQRKRSRNHTRTNGALTPRNVTTVSPSPVSNGGLKSPVIPISDLESLKRPTIAPSDSTKARVAKAKQSLELMALYHELIQLLPPLPHARSDRLGTSQSKRGSLAGLETQLGRPYNPLQYIRNRRVRALKDCPINAEAEGWADVERVREWVAKVASNANMKRRSNEMNHLSEFETPLGSGLPLASPPSAPLEGRNAQSNSRTARPRMDWHLAPWDLLADAYWMDQPDHQWLVEDWKGRKIYGNKPRPMSRRDSVSEDSKALASRRSSSRGRHRKAVSSLDQPIQVADLDDRGRARGSIVKDNESHSSQDRKRKWPHRFMRSQSSSSSQESGAENVPHVPRLRPRQTSRDRQDSRILEKQVNSLLSTQIPDDSWHRVDNADAVPKRASVKDSPIAVQVGDPDQDLGNKERDKRMQNLSSSHRSQSSFETDESTAPNSPDSRMHVPSIAVKLSPPRNRKLSKLISNNALQRLSISESKPSSNRTADYNDDRSHVTGEKPPETALGDGFLSPKSAENLGRLLRKSVDTRSAQDFHESKEPEGKRKDITKSSRIAGLMSNPVHRVGDLIRRKEAVEPSAQASPASTRLRDSSTSDEEAGSIARDGQKYLPKEASVMSGEQRSVAAGPRYHTDNLPIFRSPFRENSKTRSASDERTPDSIQDQRSRGYDRSNRFRRVGSPSLSTKSESPVSPEQPQTPPGPNRDADREQQELPQAQRRFAVVRTSPGEPGRPYPTATSTYPNPLPLPAESSMSFPDLQIRSKTKNGHQTVNARDLAYLRALVMATNVISNVNYGTLSPSAFSQAPRVDPQEYLASRFDLASAEISSIKQINEEFREDANRLSNVVVSGLHDKIRALDVRISSGLTSEVRALADGADALGVQLGTSCTLEVKQLNDRIDYIMRRRRRQFRWLRRSGYLLLEWTLLATMWWVWLVVVILRLARSIAQGIYLTARWLLWL